MQVKIYGEIYECDKAVKGADFVKLIKNGKSIAEFSGISNFDGYQIIEGEWSEPETTAEEKITAIAQTVFDMQYQNALNKIGG